MAGLSKSKIIAHRQCPKRLWLEAYKPSEECFDKEYLALMNSGHRVGAVACAQYPNGWMLPEDLQMALTETPRLLSESPRPLFEACFAHDNVACRADILLPTGKGSRTRWRMVEVKSTTEVKDYQREDIAIQTWVIEQSGLKLNGVALAHIDRDYVYPGVGRYEGLLIEKDLSADTRELIKEVPGWVAAAQTTLRKRKEPEIEPGRHCETPFKCPFATYCSPQPSEDYPVEILPGSSGIALARALRSEGYGDLRKVPADRMTTKILSKIHRLTKKSRAEVDPEAKAKLGNMTRPRYYMDFETINPGVPLWKGTKPFEKIPFQWSCHIEDRNGQFSHRSFLAQGNKDPRREFVEGLLDTLRSKGTIFVYNAAFECGVLRRLAELFPDLVLRIEAILARVVDLLPIAREHYYHRDQKGSWSIKAILPTIAPALNYDDLDVSGGGDAMVAYASTLNPETPGEERIALREQLLDYCARDTEAMIELVKVFEEA